MDASLKILSDLSVFTKYARYLPEASRRETWAEIVFRNASMHMAKFPEHEEEILSVYQSVLNKEVLPSMRSMQFSGRAIEVNNSRIYNCAYLPMDSYESFHELMFLLLGGTGVGYSVQEHHIKQLPPLLGTNGKLKKYLIGDSIIGWADAVKVLVRAYVFNKPMPRFDFSDIREKGALLKTAGGKAPGPQPLKDTLHNIQKILDGAIVERGIKTQLTSLEVHDMNCYIADAVLAGGIRRSAMIALFSYGDTSMLECKFGKWWEANPQRARSNNSVTMVRSKARKKNFEYIWERIKASGAGEPGIYWTNNKDWGANPCCEIALKPFQFCNLSTVNVGDVDTQEELNKRVCDAAFIGTLQASYTDFHYLRDVWKETTEQEALIGVSMTGIASGKVLKLDLNEASSEAVKTNERVSTIIGINSATRITTIKPEGTASCVVGSSSGIHAWHSPYYIRRMRFGKEEPVYSYLKYAIPNLVENDFFKPETEAVVSIPIKAPRGSIYRTESALELLERVKHFFTTWIKGGWVDGHNSNNVSVTVNIKDTEWEGVSEWMWENRHSYNGIAVLPYDNGSYIQAPFEEINKQKYEEMIVHARNIDLTKVKEVVDETNLKGEIACSGGKCEI